MYPRILTNTERKAVHEYLRRKRSNDPLIRQLVSRSRRHSYTISADMQLLKQLTKAYSKRASRKAQAQNEGKKQ